ncbi:MAG: hypothetical protein JWM95_2847 [Gemmatimonadetes bacterium]|nr:hypothetical protein [Gemmatimonadota bacterium]
MKRLRTHTAAVLASTLLMGGCPLLPTDVTATGGAPATVTIVQGDNQIAQAGRALSAPIVLRVVDASGKGVARQTATVVVVSGGGTVTPATAVSDSSGELKLSWTLGSASITQQLLATVKEGVAASLLATAVYPTTVVLAQGTSQTGKVATALKNDVVVRVVGPSNQPMIGVPVSFAVVVGGGAITPQSGVTNSLGEISAKWTLGGVAGPNLVVATSGTLPPVPIPATATP